MYNKNEITQIAEAASKVPGEQQEGITNQLNTLIQLIAKAQKETGTSKMPHSFNDGKELSLPVNLHIRLTGSEKAFNDKFDKDPWLSGTKSLTENLPGFLEEFMSYNKWFSEWLQEAPANTALFIAKPAECFQTICKEKKVTISPEMEKFLDKEFKIQTDQKMAIPGLTYQQITTSFYKGENDDKFDMPK